jgi:hypothetical protein
VPLTVNGQAVDVHFPMTSTAEANVRWVCEQLQLPAEEHLDPASPLYHAIASALKTGVRFKSDANVEL